MNFLLKNAIRYIFKSKVSIILLGSIIFISSGLFSLLGSMSSSMQDSFSTLGKFSSSQNIVIDENYKSFDNSYQPTCKSEGNKYIYSINYNDDIGSLISSNFKDKTFIVPNPLSQPCFVDYIKDKSTENLNSDSIFSNSIKPYHESAISQIESYVSLTVETSFINNIYDSNILSSQDSLVSTDSITVKSQTLDSKSKLNNFIYKPVYKDYSKSTNALQNIYKYEGESFSSPIEVDKILEEENYYKKYMNSLNLEGITDDSEIEKDSSISIEFIKNNRQFINKSTEYSLGATRTISVLGNSIPKSAGVFDPTSVETIISPTYAEKNNIKPIKKSDLYKQKYFTSIGVFKSDVFAKDYPNSIIKLGKLPFVVIGVGTTSDFAYPIIDSANIAVDTENQAIVFMNKSSFSRVYDSNRESSREKYISIYSNSKNLDKIVSSLNELAAKYMNWPSNLIPTKISYLNEDNINLSNYRERTLDSIRYSISSMTIYSSIFLAVLCGFIIYVIVKRKILESKKSLSILQANGYSKSSIALSMTSIALFIGILPNMLGYLTGLILQKYIFSVFSSYWTLPYYYQGFSVLTMLLIVFIPLFFISLISYLTSLVSLKGRLIDNISMSTEKPNILSYYVSKIFFFLPIKPRFSLLLLSKNITKMLIISAACAASTSASIVAFSIFGKFDEAKDRTDSINKYKYRVDLLTPTIEGGQYSALFGTPYPQWQVDSNINPLENKPTLFFKKDNNSFLGYNSRNELIRNQEYDKFKDGDPSNIWHNSYFAIPEVKGGDIPGFNSSYDRNLNYLNHKIQFEPFLKLSIAGVAPWESAKNQIPENFRLSLQENAQYFYNEENEINDLVKEITDYGYISKFRNNFSVHKDIDEVRSIFNSDLRKISNSLSLVSNDSIYKELNSQERQKYIDIINSGIFSISENDFWIDSNIGKGDFPIISINLPTNLNYEDFNNILNIFNKFLEFNSINYRYGSIKNKIIQADPNFFAYNQLIINNNDELYTHLDLGTNVFSSDVSVTGIDLKSKNIVLNTEHKNILESFDQLEEYNPLEEGSYLPVLINHFIAEKNSLKIGDYFNAKLKNSMYRYLYDYNPEVKIKVVGIIDTYDKNQIITSRNLANKSISWTSNKKRIETEKTISNNSIDKSCKSFFADYENALNTPYNVDCNDANSYKFVFNGVFSNSEKPSVLDNLHLYSESGIYPGVESLSPNVLNSSLFSEKNKSAQNWMSKFSSNYSLSDELSWSEKKEYYIKKYTRNIYSSLLTSSIDVKSVSSYSFDNSAKLVSTNVWIILSVVLSISLGFSIIMGVNIIDENKKNISILKTLGFKNSEITNMIIGSYSFPIILGLVFSIPTTVFIISIIKTLIIAFGSITIPIPLIGLGLVYGIVLSLGSLSITMYLKIRSSISSDSIKALKA